MFYMAALTNRIKRSAQKLHFATSKVPTGRQCKQNTPETPIANTFFYCPTPHASVLKQELSCWTPQPDPENFTMDLVSKALLLGLLLVLTDAAPA